MPCVASSTFLPFSFITFKLVTARMRLMANIYKKNLQSDHFSVFASAAYFKQKSRFFSFTCRSEFNF